MSKYHIEFSDHFKKAYKKRIAKTPNLKKKFEEKLELFKENDRHPSLKTHKLEGILQDNYAFKLGAQSK